MSNLNNNIISQINFISKISLLCFNFIKTNNKPSLVGNFLDKLLSENFFTEVVDYKCEHAWEKSICVVQKFINENNNVSLLLVQDCNTYSDSYEGLCFRFSIGDFEANKEIILSIIDYSENNTTYLESKNLSSCFEIQLNCIAEDFIQKLKINNIDYYLSEFSFDQFYSENTDVLEWLFSETNNIIKQQIITR